MDKSKTPKVISILSGLELRGELKELFRLGVVPTKYKRWLQIWWMVDIEMRQGKNKSRAVESVSEKFTIEEESVYRILRKFSS